MRIMPRKRIIPKNWPRDLPVPPPIPQQYFKDRRWMMEHHQELVEQFPDQWVAVFKAKVVAAGKDLSEVVRVAHEVTGERDIATHLVEATRMFYPSQR